MSTDIKTKFGVLKQREESLKQRVSGMQGSIQVLKAQFTEATTKLKAEFGIDANQLEEYLANSTAELDRLVNELEVELTSYEGLV